MQSYKSVNLYLDCDATGQKCSQKAIALDHAKFVDESALYKNYKDMNDWAVHIGQSPKQSMNIKQFLFHQFVINLFRSIKLFKNE